MYEPRTYRDWVTAGDLVSYSVKLKETDLLIRTRTDLSAITLKVVTENRKALEEYIRANPFFAASFAPVDALEDAPFIVKLMAGAARIAEVGPMAAVAGAFSEIVGGELSKHSCEVIVENGGDNYLLSEKERIVAVYAGDSPLSGKVGLKVPSSFTPIGICTSSATVGPSINLGKADAVVIASKSAALADASATAVGNAIKSDKDIQPALELAGRIDGVIGAVIIKGDRIGAWGQLEICRIG
jgi:uncharacterized protein